LVSGHCNDGNACTNDSCVSGVCVHTNNTVACNDGLFCTVNDLCSGGTCVGNTNPCSGGLFCSEATDGCVECLNDGHCSDGNVCTDDICLSGNCFNPANTASCSDGQFCTANDVCSGGVCVGGGGNPCPGQLCDETNNFCVECFTAANCVDGIPCTSEQCVAGSCVRTPNNALCNDNLFCSGAETCILGVGCVSAGTPCDSAALCDEAADFCRCASPAVVVEGPRHIAVTPALGATPVAIRVDSSDGDLTCLPKYAAADGTLVDAPVFRTPAAWGTTHLTGALIEPSTLYTVESDCRVLPTAPENLSPATSVQTNLWGDLNGSGVVDVDDMIIMLIAFAAPPSYHADLFPCDTNNIVDIDDILSVLAAFSGGGYPCPAPCP